MGKGFEIAPVLRAAPRHIATAGSRLSRLVAALSMLGAALLLSGCATPLHDAAERGDVQAVRTLLDQGSPVDEKNFPDQTALHLAAYRGQTEVMTLLLDRGANINAKNIAESTPLHSASEAGQLRAVRLLLDRGADINAKDKKFGTALNTAAFGGYTQVARLLLERGALAGETDGYYRRSASAWAKEGRHVALARLLEQAEAQQLAPHAPSAPAVATRPPTSEPTPPPTAQPSTTSGSGFLLRQTNLILTNYHVVRDRKELTLRFPSGEEYRGRVVAQDRGMKGTDIALT